MMLRNRDKGFRYVRLRKNSKRPIDPQWSANPLSAEAVEEEHYGIHLGASRLIIVDEDKLGAGQAWLTETGRTLPPTRRVRTASGKLHLYYSVPAGVDAMALHSRVGYREGLDLLAGMRQACGPGTIIDGRRYVIEAHTPITEAPAWLVELVTPLRRNPRQTASNPYAGNDGFFYDDVAPMRKSNVINKIDEKIDTVRKMSGVAGTGMRDIIMAAAFTAGGLLHTGLFQEWHVREELHKALVGVFGSVLPEDELWIDQGLKDGQRKPIEVVDDDPKGFGTVERN